MTLYIYVWYCDILYSFLERVIWIRFQFCPLGLTNITTFDDAVYFVSMLWKITHWLFFKAEGGNEMRIQNKLDIQILSSLSLSLPLSPSLSYDVKRFLSAKRFQIKLASYGDEGKKKKTFNWLLLLFPIHLMIICNYFGHSI